MRWQRTLQLVDVHCEGEIGRVVTAGVLDLPGETIADKLEHINRVDDSLRRTLVLEPRGGPTVAVVLLLPATHRDADVGFILLLANRAYAVSGSNLMCAATALIETGAIEMTAPETRVTFDTAAGLVTTIAECRAGRVDGLRVDMPPAFVERLAAEVDTPDFGRLTYDIAFGGMYFALIDVAQTGLTITPDNAGALARAGVAIRNQIADEVSLRHPDIADLDTLTHVMFTAQAEDGAVLTCTTMRPGRVDRSACGTGSAALAALRVAKGTSRTGDTLRTRSIIGSEFSTHIVEVDRSGDLDTVHTTLTGPLLALRHQPSRHRSRGSVPGGICLAGYLGRRPQFLSWPGRAGMRE